MAIPVFSGEGTMKPLTNCFLVLTQGMNGLNLHQVFETKEAAEQAACQWTEESGQIAIVVSAQSVFKKS